MELPQVTQTLRLGDTSIMVAQTTFDADKLVAAIAREVLNGIQDTFDT